MQAIRKEQRNAIGSQTRKKFLLEPPAGSSLTKFDFGLLSPELLENIFLIC